ncbi:mannitol dehydrogenase family protein [Paracandidimonas lactea]|uniref:mannitol dehydrogenase family protein n=1 Tax=Paracandidimonas lactea TaxID=2895524 RepID=UPI001F45135F|nr:mannitol dehydrogenase family protein [Paracandidimonas lactea]
MRLSAATLAALPVQVARPSYPRSRVQASVVHLGSGAFHRAHQAYYTDAVLRSGDLAWGIVGASLMSADKKLALQPQDGLYTLSEIDGGGEALRVIGSIVGLYGGRGDLLALLARMADAATRIVSLTVTEKGYHLDPSSGLLQLTAPDVAADLARPDAPETILGLVVEALRRRRAAGVAPFTVLSCDNLPQNGTRARAAVLAYAWQRDEALARWIEAEVPFPCTMVDRITPATTDADRARIEGLLGMHDAWPIVTEPFSQWVIEDRFAMGRPDWTVGGAVFSDDIEAWEAMKLRCLNGAHSTLAYLACLSGCETVADAMVEPMIVDAIDALWREVCAVTQAPRGLDATAYVQSLKRRFGNPALRHRTAQIAMDGSQKLPQRLLAPLRDRIAQGLDSPALVTALAAWMLYVSGVAQGRLRTTLEDPLSARLLETARRSGDTEALAAGLLSIESMFGRDLGAQPELKAALARRIGELAAHPAIAPAIS